MPVDFIHLVWLRSLYHHGLYFLRLHKDIPYSCWIAGTIFLKPAVLPIPSSPYIYQITPS